MPEQGSSQFLFGRFLQGNLSRTVLDDTFIVKIFIEVVQGLEQGQWKNVTSLSIDTEERNYSVPHSSFFSAVCEKIEQHCEFSKFHCHEL